jgi:hypothetical protein
VEAIGAGKLEIPAEIAYPAAPFSAISKAKAPHESRAALEQF